MLFLQALVFAMSTAALSVTAPTEGSSISQSETLTVTWSTVSTDSQSFNIELALSTDAGNEQTLSSNVSPSTLSYSTPASAYAAGNYTINLVGTTQTSSGILAQSKWFLITASTGSSASSARSSAAGTSSTAAVAGAATSGTTASTATSARASGSAGASGSAVSSGAAASSSPTTTASTSGSQAIIFSAASLLAGFAAYML